MNGIHDRVLASFTGTRHASAATRGSAREAAIAELGQSLPTVARLCRGDIIDASGAHTGQLDGIVVHANSPAVALSGAECIVLAEGAIGVIEVKSNLRSQWREVLTTWGKLCKIRRPLSRQGRAAQALSAFQNPDHAKAATLWIHEQAVSFFVIGWKGWATSTKLEEKVRELHTVFGKGPRPQLFVGQLEPPGFAVMSPTGENVEVNSEGATMYEYDLTKWLARDAGDARGVVLLSLWSMLTDRARNAPLTDIDWHAYLDSSPSRTINK